jgi:hypothetical protein
MNKSVTSLSIFPSGQDEGGGPRIQAATCRHVAENEADLNVADFLTALTSLWTASPAVSLLCVLWPVEAQPLAR